MRYIAPILTVIALTTILTGCPYKSSVPLADATEKVNLQMFGKWLPKTELGKPNPAYYVIEMRDSLHYDIDHFQYNEQEKDYNLKEYIAWSTRINNLNFMNVQGSGEQEYYLHRLDVMGDDLMILFQVTSNIDEQFEKSSDLREFVRKHSGLSFFYNKDEVKLIRNKD